MRIVLFAIPYAGQSTDRRPERPHEQEQRRQSRGQPIPARQIAEGCAWGSLGNRRKWPKIRGSRRFLFPTGWRRRLR